MPYKRMDFNTHEAFHKKILKAGCIAFQDLNGALAGVASLNQYCFNVKWPGLISQIQCETWSSFFTPMVLVESFYWILVLLDTSEVQCICSNCVYVCIFRYTTEMIVNMHQSPRNCVSQFRFSGYIRVRKWRYGLSIMFLNYEIKLLFIIWKLYLTLI